MRGLLLILCVALLVVGTDNLVTKVSAVAPQEEATLAPPVIEIGAPPSSAAITVADCATCPNQGTCPYIVSQTVDQSQDEVQATNESCEARPGGPLRRIAQARPVRAVIRAKPARRVLRGIGRIVCRRR